MIETNYPAEIEGTALDLAILNARIHDIARLIQQADDAIAFDVLFAVDPQTGKPLFSNEAQRSIAIRDKQRADQNWCELAKEMDAAEMNRARLSAKLERLRGEFSTWKILKRAEIAWALATKDGDE